MKKILSFILVLTLCMSLSFSLISCGGDGGDETDKGDPGIIDSLLLKTKLAMLSGKAEDIQTEFGREILLMGLSEIFEDEIIEPEDVEALCAEEPSDVENNPVETPDDTNTGDNSNIEVSESENNDTVEPDSSNADSSSTDNSTTDDDNTENTPESDVESEPESEGDSENDETPESDDEGDSVVDPTIKELISMIKNEEDYRYINNLVINIIAIEELTADLEVLCFNLTTRVKSIDEFSILYTMVEEAIKGEKLEPEYQAYVWDEQTFNVGLLAAFSVDRVTKVQTSTNLDLIKTFAAGLAE